MLIEFESKALRTYPYICRTKDNTAIILMGEPGCGMVIGGTLYDIGFYDNEWDENVLFEVTEEVTLRRKW